MKKVLALLGTRPEAVKMAPVVRALKSSAGVECRVCSTGQHKDTLVGILELFDVAVDVQLDVMQPNQSLGRLTAKLFDRLDGVLDDWKPDWILAQGDTTSVMAAALSAFYRRVHFGHVEAGLRTYDRWHPFPEEINRRIADLVADAYFAPTETARANLVAENASAGAICVTGNTVVDALHYAAAQPYEWANGPLYRLQDVGDVVLVTVHRRESFGEPMAAILRALARLADEFPQHRFVLPVHPNPGVSGAVRQALGRKPNVDLHDPLDYRSMVAAMAKSRLILTDSGGIQEEAPSLNVPVLVLRDKTERPEGVECGAVKLVGADERRIFAESSRLLADPAARAAMQNRPNPYGDGRASERIRDWILKH